jgi:hypothetical protein
MTPASVFPLKIGQRYGFILSGNALARNGTLVRLISATNQHPACLAIKSDAGTDIVIPWTSILYVRSPPLEEEDSEPA